MRIPVEAHGRTLAGAMAAALAACSANSIPSSGVPMVSLTVTQQMAESPAVDPLTHRGASVYAAMSQQTNRYALPDSKNRAPKCTLAANFPKGIAVDSAGTLWVTNDGSAAVTTYKKGSCKQLPLTLNVPGSPFDVAFSSTGTVYVTVNTAGGSALVSVYGKGSSTPTSTLSDSAMTAARGVAVDNADNVFVACVRERQHSCVIEFENGMMPGKYLDVQVGTSDGLEFDSNQNLIVIDPGSRLAEVFAPPYSGAPNSTIGLRGSSEFGKLDAKNKNLYVSNFSSGTVDVFAYPSGSYEYSISNGLQADAVQGVAVYPASKN